MGLLYGLVSPNVSAPPAAKGVAWGLAVWAGSYAGWLPAAGILPPPHRRPMRRNVNIILAHVAWGALLGLLTSVFADDEDA